MTTDNELPKQELLIKLLKMTTVSEDTMAVVAIRKANALLDAAGWDWERLIQGKIKVIEDPFKNLGTPAASASSPKHHTQPAPPARSAPVTPPKRTTWPLGIIANQFAGPCYCCGIEVIAGAGFIFKPIIHHVNGVSAWKVACVDCNGTNTKAGALVNPYPAAKRRAPRGRHNVSDLA